ncbi:alpha-ketoglutarate-dependent dioxygenase AlkB [Streptacidiphilus sp. N1-12]|uniref:Alpha-ketoglutarate-dependent dioxygenase AlkB n=2 Tax=Streptacidiphilus alkalitolerans TaxID=3342712 RepID=A0ABV6VGZ9_9ACTN
MAADGLFPLPAPPRRQLAPGAVHVPGWLDPPRQRQLAAACRDWALGPVPARAAVLPGGARMSVRTVCLGWHWQPYRYSRTADDAGGGRVAELPDWLADLGRAALADAWQDHAAARDYRPDTALINFYQGSARMGMHQDKDERSDQPVVSFSIGDSCLFRFGNPDTRNRPYTDVELASGDVFVFGGPSRFCYHGVPKTIPGTAPDDSGHQAGRINITLRRTGLAD